MEKWPNFFIVGTMKAGTTSLWEYFKTIPGIFMSHDKEPKYFSPLATQKGLHQIKDKKEYLAQFDNSESSIAVGEASPIYIRDPESAKLMHEQIPHAKIIISLRDPIERLHSQYFMDIRLRRYQGTFHEYLQNGIKNEPKNNDCNRALRTGIYTDDVKGYLKVFGQNQVKILIFEEWTKNVKKTIQDLLNFLGIVYEVTDDFDDSIKNKYREKKILGGNLTEQIIKNDITIKVSRKIISKSRRQWLRNKLIEEKTNIPKPKMESKERELLKNFYNDDIRNLENLLGRKLPWGKDKNC